MKKPASKHSCGLTYLRWNYGKCPRCQRQTAVKLILAMVVNGKTSMIDEVV
jgi:hypothetical protein